METEFQKLVQDMDGQGLESLRAAVLGELEQRRQKTAIRMEDIRPGMAEADRERARMEIARVLRGEE